MSAKSEQADDRLARFGAALRELPPSPLAVRLTAKLAASVRCWVEDLRQEMAAWDQAIAALDVLKHSRFLPTSADGTALSAELQNARDNAARVLDVCAQLVPSPSGRIHPLPQLCGGADRVKEILSLQGPAPLTLPSPSAKPGGEGVGQDNGFPKANNRNSRDSPHVEGKGVAGDVGGPSRNPVSSNSVAAKPPITGNNASSNRLQLRCPSCGEIGVVCWDRLNRIQNCRRCHRHFAVRADGSPVEVVKRAGNRWAPRSKKARFTGAPLGRRRLLIAAAALLALPLIAVAGWRVSRPTASAQVEPELQRELLPRAEAFAHAWRQNDVRTMKRLTSPAQDRMLYAWFTRHRSPLVGTEPPGGLKIEVVPQATHGDKTTLRVRFAGLGPEAGRNAVELMQTWERRGETWYFVPPAK